MGKKFKSLIFALVGIMMFGIVGMVGCTKNSTEMPTEPISPEDKAMTKPEEYKNMLDEKIKTYMGDIKLSTEYDFSDVTDDSKKEVYDAYKKYYTNLDTELTNLENELKTNVVKGDAIVDKANQQIINNIGNLKDVINKNLNELDTNMDSILNMSKEDFTNKMKELEKSSYEARVKLQNSIEEAQNSL